MKIDTEHGNHMLFKSAMEGAKKNTLDAANNSVEEKTVIKKETGVQPPEEKGTVFDSKA